MSFEKRMHKNMLRVFALLSLAALTTGCITARKQSEVNGVLRDVGFSEADARCLATRAGRQLTVRELRSLQRAASAMEQPVREMPVGEVIDAIRNNVDPQTLSIIGGLAAECAQQRQQAAAQ